MLAGKEIMGKSSDSVGGGEEVAGVLEAGVPFPPAQIRIIRSQRKTNTLQHILVEIFSNVCYLYLMCSGSGWEGVRHCGRALNWATCPWRMGAWPCHTMRRGSTEGPSPRRKS